MRLVEELLKVKVRCLYINMALLLGDTLLIL